MRARLGAVVAVLLVPWGVGQSAFEGAFEGAWESALAQTEAPVAQCAKADFEAVVDAAGAALRDLAQKNTPVFQGKLRKLKVKRNWTNDEFLKQAEPLVRDETTAGYYKKSEKLVGRITGGGSQAKAASTAPDCALLDSLKADLKVLLETQQAKWAHMLGKVEKELAK